MDKPLIRICNTCADLFPEAKAKLLAAARAGEVRIGPGICLGHFKEYLTEVSAEQKKELLAKFLHIDANPPPDLREHPELVEAYLRGKFCH